MNGPIGGRSGEVGSEPERTRSAKSTWRLVFRRKNLAPSLLSVAAGVGCSTVAAHPPDSPLLRAAGALLLLVLFCISAFAVARLRVDSDVATVDLYGTEVLIPRRETLMFSAVDGSRVDAPVDGAAPEGRTRMFDSLSDGRLGQSVVDLADRRRLDGH